MPEACRRTGLCRSWLYHLIRAGEFPQPVKIGSYAVAFIESEVDEWINLRIAKSRKLAP
ncbi:AlpA family transcriptional regulator [Sodalis endosymbiont of Spalangia cameroni]|uniref:helix-turn-helix transcriptional regulator n=1 Tax=Sodalis praecaptivus TaxID=1239307 RepID=UPI0031F7F151